MSAQLPNTQKGQRRPIKKSQHGGQHSRSVVSDVEAYTIANELNAGASDGKTRPRRKSHAPKKGYGHNDAAAYSDSSTRPASHHHKTQATPIKEQAYAGPTFHQSPAASALPLPSFYSKSLPTASPLKSRIDAKHSPNNPARELNQIEMPPLADDTKRETTPLDFLFDAARKAGATPGTESPNHRQYLSSTAATPISRSPAARDGDTDFPFELDSGDQGVWEDGSAMSTPYKERIEAARSQRTPSTGSKSLNEDERKVKAAELKKFLMNTASASNGEMDNNPFNARPAPPQYRQHQHRSSPNTPYSPPSQGNHQQYFPPMPIMPNMMQYQSPSRHGPSSNLRNVYQPGLDGSKDNRLISTSTDQPRISTAREQPPNRLNFGDIYNSSSRPQSQGSGHRATPSAQQLEDDLRKILKLDLVSSG